MCVDRAMQLNLGIAPLLRNATKSLFFALVLSLILSACGGGAQDDTPLVGASPTPVRNAGLVLLNPFVPRLFELNGYMEGGQFKDRAHQEQAVHLLHYAATGQEVDVDDSMAMAKFLCGMAIDEPLARRASLLSEPEKELANRMLQAVASSWTLMNNASMEGLRETFIQRIGALQDRGSHSELLVEPKALDVLLDQYPAYFERIQYAWMPEPLVAKWSRQPERRAVAAH